MTAFVIIPFSSDYDDIYKLGIKETAEKLHVRAYRLDEELFEEGMLEKIYSEIEKADFIIAELSDKNPNVFYELGYAHAIGKLCIHLTKEATSIPFDLKHKQHIVYGNKLSYLQEQLGKNIKWAVEEIEKRKKSPFAWELKAVGDLEKTEEYAEATLNFTLEVENKTSRVSPEIQAVYLHSVQKWEIKQKGNKIPNKKSELRPYAYKYHLITDISKIPSKGWTQIEFSASRILALAFDGDELRDSYFIQGTLFFEIMTDKGNFSEKMPLSVTVDSLPF